MTKKIKKGFYKIAPPKGFIKIDFSEIWHYRELFWVMVWRNIKIRYKQTLIGAGWAVFQPLLSMLVFTVFFGIIVKIPSQGQPYAVWVYTGLIFWNYFQSALTSANNSLIESQGIVQKVYFPRLIIPFTTTVTPLLDFFLSFLILIGMMTVYHSLPSLTALFYVPFLLLIEFLFSTGLGLIALTINTRYRDVAYALTFFLQVLLYVSPVIYPITLIPEQYRFYAYLNPMAGVITVARDSLLKTAPVNHQVLLMALGISLVILLFGVFLFNRSEKNFADYL